MMISARCAPSAPAAGPPAWPAAGAVTVTIALTSRPPSGRYSFWKTSRVKSLGLVGLLIGRCLLGRSGGSGSGGGAQDDGRRGAGGAAGGAAGRSGAVNDGGVGRREPG